jgi:hypothetical protein
MKIMPVVKIVFLSTIMLVALTLLTVQKPEKISKGKIDIVNLPQKVELIGYKDIVFNTSSIIKKGCIIFVGNSQSIAIVNELEKQMTKKNGSFVVVSNISSEPWFVKRWQIQSKDEKLKGTKTTPWIYDDNGQIRNFLQVPTSDPLRFFIYKVDNLGIIHRIFIGKVTVDKKDGTVLADIDKIAKIIKDNK